MTWEIFLGIAALSAFMTSIMAVVVKVTRVLSSIETNLGILSSTFEKSREKNEKEHEAFEKRLISVEKTNYIQQYKMKNLERSQ